MHSAGDSEIHLRRAAYVSVVSTMKLVESSIASFKCYRFPLLQSDNSTATLSHFLGALMCFSRTLIVKMRGLDANHVHHIHLTIEIRVVHVH